MMQLIRDKAHGVVAWVIVAMVAIAFCSWGVSGFISGRSSSVMAVVNGQKITSSEVDDLYNRWLRMASMQKSFDITKVDPQYIRQQITKNIAEQRAIINGLETKHIDISEMLVVDNIRQDKHLQDNGKFSKDRFEQFLKQINIDENYFARMRREDLMVEQVQQALIASSFSLKGETDRIIKLKNQARSFGYSVIAANKNQIPVKISEQEVNEYFAKNAAAFIAPEKVKLEYLELSINDLVKSIKVDDQKLREYYNNNLASFTDPELFHLRHIFFASNDAKNKVDAIYAQLKQGADFVTLAKKQSEDQQTAVRGGDLDWTPKSNDLPPEVFALKKANEFTPPVQTAYGWHVFQLVERKESKPKDFTTVKKLIEARYIREEAERMFSSEGNELASLAYEHPQSLSVASEKLGLPIQSTDFITRQSNSGLAKSAAVIKAAFSDDVLSAGHNSDLIRIDDDTVAVVRVAEKQPQHQQSLAEVRDQIVSHLQAQAVQAKAKQLGEALLKDLKQGVAPSKAAANAKVQWKVARNLVRDDKTVPANILQQVFVMPRPAKGEAFTTHAFQVSNGDYVVLALTDVIDGKLAATKDMMSEDKLALQLAIIMGRLEYYSLQADLIKDAKIEYVELNDKKSE
jgi:peptidyl-prolyl cis-trans isomerase D